jgi:hypothetical protein
MRCRLLLCLCGLTLAGCTARELCTDQDKLRCALLDLYTNQIMDNLIRAAKGLPIIQLDYLNATAQVTLKETATVSDGVARTRSDVFTAVAATSLALTRSTVNTLMGGATIDHSNQLSVTAAPVTTSDAVYDAYREFLALPGSLQVSCTPPPCEAVHLCKQCGKEYYWVPVEYQKEFLALALATTAQRATLLPAPDAFYPVTVLQVVSRRSTKFDDVFDVIVKIDKKIPNDTGRIEIGSGTPSGGGKPAPTPADGGKKGAGKAEKAPAEGKGKKVDGKPEPAPADGPIGPPGFEISQYNPPPPNTQRLLVTDHLRIIFDQRKAPSNIPTVEALVASVPVAAKVYLRRHRPHMPSPNEALNRIEFQLQQIQFNQIRLGP